MAAIAAGGKEINFDTGVIKDKKKKSSSKISSGRTITVTPTITETSTGKVVQAGTTTTTGTGGSRYKAKSSSSGGVTQMNDTRTGLTTISTYDSSGKKISENISKTKANEITNLKKINDTRKYASLNNILTSRDQELFRQKYIQSIKSQDNARQLFAKGYQADQVTDILRRRAEVTDKYKNLDVSKFYQGLQDKPLTRGVDTTSQIQAFKIGVNQELRRNFMPTISFNEPITTFEQRYKQLQQSKEKFETPILAQTKAQLKEKVLSVEEKARTKQSLTPSQQIELYSKQRINDKKLTDEQLKIAKKIILSPVNYGKSLRLRYEAGENNPLFKDLSGVGIGFLKEVGDTINFVTGVKGITINSKGETYDGLIALPARKIIDYSINLTKRIQTSKKPKQELKKDLNKIVKGLKGVGKTVIDVTEFSYRNPSQTLLLVGGSITAGVIKSKSSFLKNPQENIGRALLWVFPNKILSGIGKVSTKLVSKLDKLIFSEETLATSIKLEKALSTLKSTEKAKLLESLNPKLYKNLTPREAEQLYSILKGQIQIDTKIKSVIPKQVLTNIGKTKTLSLADTTKALAQLSKNDIKILEPKVDKINKSITKSKNKYKGITKLKPETISKKIGELFQEKPIKIKVKNKLIKDEEQLIYELKRARKTSGQEFKKLKTKIKKDLGLNVIERRNKDGEIIYKLLEPKEQRKLGIKTGKKSRVKEIQITPKTKTITIEPPKEKYYTNRELDKIEKQIGLELKRAKTRKSKTLFDKRGSLTFQQSIRRTYNKVSTTYNKVKSKTKKLNKQYKRYIQQQKKIKSKKTGATKLDYERLKKFKSKLKSELSDTLLESRTLQKESQGLIKSLKKIQSLVPALAVSQAFIQDNLSKLSQSLAQDQESLQESITSLSNVNILKDIDLKNPTPKPKKSTSDINTKTLISKQSIKIIKQPPINQITPTKPKPIEGIKPRKKPIKIKLPISSYPTSNVTRQGYLVKIKKGNKVLFYTDIPLPRKRSVNLARKYTDKSIGASHSLTKNGQTSIVDVTKRLLGNKFRPKKSKNPKVQLEVEKRKFRIDSPSEISQLKSSKKTLKTKSRFKPKFKTKTKTSVKNTLKKKKVLKTSQKRPKKNKKTIKKK